ncbi:MULTISPECIES: alpha/beta hydrolase [Micromonospora]|uniref:Alpha/beta hydrolase n=1 Tax=Micromonospora solifontis TaxID=2487138 RepID=A0ABX9WDC5_9ACTN|nr:MULTISPECIES: alpha/beta hydrolase [Micromonospora]NES13886.1 alpha/beta hydrolase [Micromonospora sp. PPF5-17B]NES37955.1 alpha/beta hydrolase [Micromonospora solifontis]NES53986.1 alpha/beta hydrolase [Micromonospora sp. PPF5-6]RNL97804.1 alpha/beta hydrolase [Micromonospora solifontis]
MGVPTGRVDTIVLIHGLWMTSRSWEKWVDRYAARGFRVLTPAWPGMDREVEQLRADPSPIADQRISNIVDHYAAIIRDLPRPPIIMGHSFGGLITQLLVDRGLGAAGVAIHPAQIKGVVKLPLATLRSSYSILHNPANRHRAVPFTREEFRYSFGNTISQEESDAAWERYAVPGAGHVLFEAAFANLNPDAATKVDTKREDRAPLLLTAGGEDHVVPPSVVSSNANLYRGSNAITSYREFPGRSHFVGGEPGWEEEADFALEWAVEAANEYSPTVVSEAPRRR